MSKASKHPILYNECWQISISALNEWGYLKAEQYKSGKITWSRGEGEYKEITGQIDIIVETGTEPYLELDYRFNGKPISYRVPLILIPSNLGIGCVWFFVCPQTGECCRKLYFVGERFLHRKAFKGCMYGKQTYSKRGRMLDSSFVYLNAKEKMKGRYFKRYYNGKPTKRYCQLLKKAEKTFSLNEVMKLLK
jgi:hypothetical protein